SLAPGGGGLGGGRGGVRPHHGHRAGEWERGLPPTGGAGARALAFYARPEAAALHWQALDLLARLPASDARRSIYVDIVLVLLDLPGWAGAGERYPAGMRHLAEAGRISGEAWEEDRLARGEGFQAYFRRDEALFVSAIGRARQAGRRGAEAVALHLYLLFLGQSGRYTEALAHAGHLIETYGAEGKTFQQALAISGIGRCWAARA